MPSLKPPDDLVTTDWLAENLGHPDLQIIDIRGYVNTIDLGGGHQQADYIGACDEYDQGHIPGSLFIDWTTDITDPDAPVRSQLAPPDRFKAAMEARGIGDDTLVIAVDHTGGHFATRLWWALRAYGHHQVAVLDGGFKKWQREGRPLTTDVATPRPATFTPRYHEELRVEAEDVLTHIEDDQTLIVDARDEPQYTGNVWRGSRAGHIPSAVNISSKSLVNPDGTWKPLEEQRQILTEGGVAESRPVIAYCNGGVTATAVLFALHRTGHSNWSNYDGSWNEWGERHDLPTATGSSPTW